MVWYVYVCIQAYVCVCDMIMLWVDAQRCMGCDAMRCARAGCSCMRGRWGGFKEWVDGWAEGWVDGGMGGWGVEGLI
jgi:hypothetical protein